PAGATVAAQHGDDYLICTPDGCWEMHDEAPFAPSARAADDERHPGAPMPGRVVAVLCETGQRVAPGEPLIVLEAMKMEYTLQARVAGIVERVLYAVGDMVDAEVPLVVITPDE